MPILKNLFGPPNVESLEAKKDVEGLIKALGYEKDDKIRLAAASALGKVGDARAVEPLTAALKEKGSLWEAATWALGNMGAPAVESLIALLEDLDNDVRLAAVIALGQTGDSRAVEPLMETLYWNLDDNVRAAAVMALGHIGDPRAIERLTVALEDADDNVSDLAAQALAKIKDRPGK